MISQKSREIIAATLPAVKENALAITSTFYPLMFERYPQVKAYFNESHQREGTQRQALANAVVAYASNLDRLEVLGDAVSLIVQKHTSLNVLPEHYPIVGECLLAAIAEIFGDAATEDVLCAWGEAYQQLADILINAEEQIYSNQEAKVGGWRGEREFILTRREQESSVITSFYLEPADGKPLVGFRPGQYIGITLNIDGREVRRNYSLSDAPGKPHYRISVKREKDGLVSNFLHDRLQAGDHVRLSAPSGDFVLNESTDPLVLLSAGVGITPTISMLEPALASGRPVHFFHCAINGDHHAFKSHVNSLADRHNNLSVTYCYSEPRDGESFDKTGFLEKQMLVDIIADTTNTDLYFLGPKPFMELSSRLVRQVGLPVNRVRFEFFGPLQDLNEVSEQVPQVA